MMKPQAQQLYTACTKLVVNMFDWLYIKLSRWIGNLVAERRFTWAQDRAEERRQMTASLLCPHQVL